MPFFFINLFIPQFSLPQNQSGRGNISSSGNIVEDLTSLYESIPEETENENGESVAEFPLTVGAIGALIAPILAAVGAIAALLTKCTIIVEKR